MEEKIKNSEKAGTRTKLAWPFDTGYQRIKEVQERERAEWGVGSDSHLLPAYWFQPQLLLGISSWTSRCQSPPGWSYSHYGLQMWLYTLVSLLYG